MIERSKVPKLWFLLTERHYTEATRNPKQYEARTTTTVRTTVSGPFGSRKQGQLAAAKCVAVPSCLSVLVVNYEQLESLYRANHAGCATVSVKRVLDTYKQEAVGSIIEDDYY